MDKIGSRERFLTLDHQHVTLCAMLFTLVTDVGGTIFVPTQAPERRRYATLLLERSELGNCVFEHKGSALGEDGIKLNICEKKINIYNIYRQGVELSNLHVHLFFSLWPSYFKCKWD